MKKHRILWVFLLILTLCAGIGTAVFLFHEPLHEPQPDNLPALTIQVGTESFLPSGGNYLWHNEKSGGGVEAPHPLNYTCPTLHLKTKTDSAVLHFESEPDSIEILCWEKSDFGNVDAAGAILETDGRNFPLQKGTCLYLVTAQWDGIPGGTVEYYFHLKRS